MVNKDNESPDTKTRSVRKTRKQQQREKFERKEIKRKEYQRTQKKEKEQKKKPGRKTETAPVHQPGKKARQDIGEPESAYPRKQEKSDNDRIKKFPKWIDKTSGFKGTSRTRIKKDFKSMSRSEQIELMNKLQDDDASPIFAPSD